MILHRDGPSPRNGRSALAAFLKVQVDLEAANTEGGRLAHFCNDPRVKQALGADFKVKMGFGLRRLWAIRGDDRLQVQDRRFVLVSERECSARLGHGDTYVRLPSTI